jgi:hypothetical protein
MSIKRNKLSIIIIFVFIFSSCSLQKKDKSNFSVLIDTLTTKSKREIFKKELYEKRIKNNLSYSLNDSTENYWNEAFGSMELVDDSDPVYKSNIKYALENYNKRSIGFQISLLEAVYTLYPREYLNEVLKVIHETSNPKLFAIGINYLINQNPEESNYYLALMRDKFSNYKNNPILFSLSNYLDNPMSKCIDARPSLTDLLSADYGKGNSVIFSLQRVDRNYTGLAIVRKPDGKFVRNDDGTIFNVPQLARARTNLPSYITNGNTPQGIFSIQGVDVSKDESIGKTTNIQLIMPFETTKNIFIHSSNSTDTAWDLQSYKNLLPLSWKNYFPIYESFYAGKAGRTEIIAHGTTIDPSFFTGKSYYPISPTLGCLCTKEIWSEENGRRLISDQQALVDALNSTGSLQGYLVVVDLDNKKMPVTINEIIMQILEAENGKNFKKNKI